MPTSSTASALLICFALAGSLALSAGCQERATQVVAPQVDESKAENPAKDSEPKWIGEPVNLFDGKTLEGWETISFGGEGDCSTENDILAFSAGDPFTGISSTSDDLPKTNFELSLEARKTDGIDFFCGLTFPVTESHCTLIVGGWGGATVGLSCINDKDASRNDTTKLMSFKQGQWYKIRVRVEPEHITAWIDDEKVVSQDIAGKQVSLRGDTELCKPLGICSFTTAAEYKNIQLRKFEPVKNQPAKTEAPSEK